MVDPEILAGRIRSLDSRIVERSGRSSNGVFPYRFWQSFSLTNWDFAVEFSIDCRKLDNGVELSSDISTTDGLIIATFPAINISDSLANDEKQRRVEAWLAGLGEFLAREAGTIVQCLVAAKQSSN